MLYPCLSRDDYPPRALMMYDPDTFFFPLTFWTYYVFPVDTVIHCEDKGH